VYDRIRVLGVLVLIPVGSRNRISELLIEKCVIGLYLLYTSQNLLGTIFRVTSAVLYRRIWSIVGNYSILCYDNVHVNIRKKILYFYIHMNKEALAMST
jgi:hypothetical protein